VELDKVMQTSPIFKYAVTMYPIADEVCRSYVSGDMDWYIWEHSDIYITISNVYSYCILFCNVFSSQDFNANSCKVLSSSYKCSHSCASLLSINVVLLNTTRQTIWQLGVEFLEKEILSSWSTFTIWNAGKQGRWLFRSLQQSTPKEVTIFLT